ncbi:MAG: universal stress protein [Solirubrobacteraceae bacterium]
MLEKIVVGYSPDQAGRDAVALAGEIAVLVDARLTIVFPYHPAFARETGEQAEERIRGEVKELTATLADSAKLEPLTIRWSTASWPIRALHELADYEHAQLIVVGAAREGATAHLKVSLMERMVHGAPCAIFVSPSGYAAAAAGAAAARAEQHPFKRIGVGFSSSQEGRAAIRLARELARAAGGNVHVIAGAGLEPALASYAFSSPALGEVEDEIYADTERTLTRVCEEICADEGVALEHETVRGDPATVLIERSGDLDLLVLGSRAYGPLRHAFLGSVSARAMREAHCPVLVLPRGAEGASGASGEQSSGAAGLA